MTGSLSIRGTVLPIGGVTAKVEAAALAGMKTVLIPKSNLQDVLVEKQFEEKIRVIPVENLPEVIDHALVGEGKEELLSKLRSMKPPKISGRVDNGKEHSAETVASESS
jgi:Lon-like ATP-dependent protease